MKLTTFQSSEPVLPPEKTSVENKKITDIQTIGGAQYFKRPPRADCCLTRPTVSIITFVSSADGKIMRRNRLSFSIFHITFFICHCLPSAALAMANEKCNMENGKWKMKVPQNPCLTA